jgi:hypothetical protein
MKQPKKLYTRLYTVFTMQDCNKCGKKIKTLYERFGASGKFEAVGYYCNRCSIFYPKNAVSQPARTVYKKDHDSIQSKDELYTNSSKPGLVEPISALMREWGRPDSNQRPPAPEAGILPS